MSKYSTELAGIGPLAVHPYPKADGIITLIVPPFPISGRAICHPLITLAKGKKPVADVALDMNYKYKETADGGLAVNVPLSLPEC